MLNPIACFFDANVWFTASRSQTGGSFLLMKLAQAGVVKVFVSNHVLEEAERNLLLKSPEHVAHLHNLLSIVHPMLITVQRSINVSFPLNVPVADVAVFDSAYTAGVDYLVSLDRKHVVNENIKSLNLPFAVVLPGELLHILT